MNENGYNFGFDNGNLSESEKVSRETILSGTNFYKLYKLFRAGGVKRFESAFNAYYVLCHNKYEASEKAIKKKYESVPEHPHEWSSDKKATHRTNFWSMSLATMNFTAALAQGVRKGYRKITSPLRKIARIPAHLDSSHRAARILARAAKGVFLPLIAAAVVAYTAFSVASDAGKDYAIGVYIDGEYVGCTENVNDILSIKRTYEKSLTERFGAQAVLKCDIEFVPEKFDKDRVILPGDTSIFDGYLQNYIKDGYGLYIDGKLAAVTETETWLKTAVDDFLDAQKRSFFNYYSVNAVGEDEILLNNNITIISDKYPRDFFLSRSEIRELFSLPVLSEDDEKQIKEHLHFINWDDFEKRASERVNFNYSIDYTNVLGTGGITEDGSVVSVMAPSNNENVSVDLVFVRTEVEKIDIPFETKLVDDPSMRRGLRRLKTPGEDGVKEVTSRVT
ncbi:MAG: G5 domain-containing protein, partial [Clostridia bacterium]|nr:G5 domain-containing protein [Clostridia bacterium]